MVGPGNLAKHDRMPLWGIGLVLEMVGQDRAKVNFPRHGPQVVQAADLRHHVFDVGSRVRHESMDGVVIEILNRSPIHYRVAFPHKTVVVKEDSITPALATPGEKLLAEDFEEDIRYFDLRTRATHIKASYTFEDLVSITNARVELKPHQVFVAHRVVQEPRPRFLLADEVGLGKTIEAGMILKELRARDLADRILVLAPASLVSQWRHELTSKFNEEFTVYDGVFLKYIEREHPGENSWKLYPRIITSVQLARREDRRDQIAEVNWDLIIFDEAHHMRRYLEGYDDRRRPKIRNTQTYLLGEVCSSNTGSLLYLTATPLQLASFELFSLVELLDPSLFDNFSDFEYFRVHVLRRLNQIHRWLTSPLGAEEYSNLLSEWRELQRYAPDLPALPALNDLDRSARDDLLERVIDIHKVAKIMIRNRRREIGGFPPRQARVVAVELTEEERAIYEAVTDYIRRGYRAAVQSNDIIAGFIMVTYQKLLASSTRALLATLRRRHTKLAGEYGPQLEESKSTEARPQLEVLSADEDGDRDDAQELSDSLGLAEDSLLLAPLKAELRELEGLIDRLASLGQDSKAKQLVAATAGILDADPEEKILIFTQFLETQAYLRDVLTRRGHRVETFSGGMSSVEKDQAVERFRESAQILISTEAGGEGRNFQFCHIMFNYDLPWNPMKVEQRIGRVDRIGQRKAVHIYNLAATGTIEERILDVLQNRIRLFEETIGSLDPILGQFERDLQRLVMETRGNLSTEFTNFAVDWAKRIEEARLMEQRLADFVMDTRSFRRDEADRLLSRELPVTHEDIRVLVEQFLAFYPSGKFEQQGDGSIHIDVPMALIQFVEGRLRDVYQGTFDPDLALRKESLQFFAIGHDLVDTILEQCTGDSFGGTAAVRQVSSLHHGGFWGVQCNFLVEYSGVRSYPKLVPIVVGFDGTVEAGRTRELALAASLPGPTPNLPEGWRETTEHALIDAELALIDVVATELSGLQTRNDADFSRLVTRTTRFYAFRIARASDRLAEEERTLARLRQSKEAGDRRIMPIWEKRVRDSREAIERLSHEKGRELAALEARRKVSYAFRLVNAAILHVPDVG